MKRIISFILVCCCSVYGVSAFTPGKNQWTGKLIFAGNSYNSIYDQDGELKRIAPVSHYSIVLKGEYGISEKFGLKAEIPFISNRISKSESFNIPSDHTVNALGDINAGFYFLFSSEENWSAKLQARQNLGTGKDNAAYGLNTGFKDYSQDVRIIMDYNPDKDYCARLQVGFIKHYNNFSNQVSAGIELGYKLHPRVNGFIIADAMQPLDDEVSIPERGGRSGLFMDNAGWITIAPELVYKLSERFSIGANVIIPVKGQYVPGNSMISAGLIFHPVSEGNFFRL